MTDKETERILMVRRQIEDRGVSDERVLSALERVPREKFVSPNMSPFAYDDRPLPIGEKQTISQPYIVAVMLEALELEPEHTVLEVGTGSGYAAAVMAEIAGRVYTVERHQSLAQEASERLEELGYQNVEVRHGDGTLGWEDKAPFDAIVVAAAGPEVPGALKKQLKMGGRLVIPVGSPQDQSLMLYRRLDEDTFEKTRMTAVRFVPLVGDLPG